LEALLGGLELLVDSSSDASLEGADGSTGAVTLDAPSPGVGLALAGEAG
jgi:hypothetical protein